MILKNASWPQRCNISSTFSDQPISINQLFTSINDYLDTLINDEQKNIGSLSQCASRTICKNFNKNNAITILEGLVPWEICEQIIADLPQELFNQQAALLLQLINNNDAPTNLKQLIIAHCLPPQCLDMNISVLYLETLSRKEQLAFAYSILELKPKEIKAIAQSDSIEKLHEYLIQLATTCNNPEDVFFCLGLAYVLNFRLVKGNTDEINPQLCNKLLPLIPFVWYEKHGLEYLAKFIDKARKAKLGQIKYSATHNKNWRLLLKVLGTIKSQTNSNHTILDEFVIPFLKEVSESEIGLYFYYFAGDWLTVTEHLSKPLKKEYTELLTAFYTKIITDEENAPTDLLSKAKELLNELNTLDNFESKKE